jgi:transcriptional regulator of heat shock response
MKKSYAIQMSFTIPDSERRIAEKAEEQFERLISRLKLVMEHLDFIYLPFYRHENIDPEELSNYRAVLRDYRDEVKKNFEQVLYESDQAMILMGQFASDTATEEMMKSFDDITRELKRQVNIFLTLFTNITSPDFRNYLLASIDSIRKQVNQFKQLINDRILEHIDTNILAKNWMSDLANKYEGQVRQRIPLTVELFQERQRALQAQ